MQERDEGIKERKEGEAKDGSENEVKKKKEEEGTDSEGNRSLQSVC